MKTEYTISQIAEKLHITTNKIRFYEKKGLLTPMRESQNRYRKFGEEDIFRLETILLYRSLGLSIEAIQNILQCNKKENYLTHMQNQWETKFLDKMQVKPLEKLRKWAFSRGFCSWRENS